MTDRRTPEQVAFDALVVEQLEAIEAGGAFDFLLDADDFEFFGWVLGWLDEAKDLGPLTDAHQATAVALVRYWHAARRQA